MKTVRFQFWRFMETFKTAVLLVFCVTDLVTVLTNVKYFIKILLVRRSNLYSLIKLETSRYHVSD